MGKEERRRRKKGHAGAPGPARVVSNHKSGSVRCPPQLEKVRGPGARDTLVKMIVAGPSTKVLLFSLDRKAAMAAMRLMYVDSVRPACSPYQMAWHTYHYSRNIYY